MKEYPDPQKFVEQYMGKAAKKRIRGMERAGMTTISGTLLNALMQRDLEACRQNYIREAEKIRDHNMRVTLREYKKDMKQIKRSNYSLRIWTCLVPMVVLGFTAWYSFTCSGDTTLGVIYTCGSLTFLGIYILGAILNRPAQH